MMTQDDASLVATMHATSWRSAYRGILSDAYLDGQVDAERHDTWTRRLATPDATRFGMILLLDGVPAGFVYVIGNADAIHGSLIDNLHVMPPARSAGLGPRLLAAAADGIAARGLDPRVHLFVYDANTRARTFYARCGGVEVEALMKATPEGTPAKEWRVAWPDLTALRRAGAHS